MTTTIALDALEHALFTRAHEGVTDLRGLIEEGIDPSVGSVEMR